MKVRRTDRANTSVEWVLDPWEGTSSPHVGVVHQGEYPTHSKLLGPDGQPLEYEPRPRLGFLP